MKLTDVTRGMDWSNNKICFKSKDKGRSLITEYLNSVYPNQIDREIDQLNHFLQVLLSNSDSKDIERHIIKHLEGFIFIDDKPYAKIAGAHDLAPSILYDFNNNRTIVKHPNLPDTNVEVVSIEELLTILNQAKSIAQDLA